MVKKLQPLLKNKKALSTIVITVILIGVSLAAIALVWGVVSNMIQKQMKNSEACFGNFEKVTLNKQYTCYTEINPTSYTLRFSLGIGEITVDKVVVGISSPSLIKSYEITNTAQPITELTMYPSGSTSVILPAKNAGLTYLISGLTSKPDSIKVAPVINGVQCDVSESILEIIDCADFE